MLSQELPHVVWIGLQTPKLPDPLPNCALPSHIQLSVITSRDLTHKCFLETFKSHSLSHSDSAYKPGVLSIYMVAGNATTLKMRHTC